VQGGAATARTKRGGRWWCGDGVGGPSIEKGKALPAEEGTKVWGCVKNRKRRLKRKAAGEGASSRWTKVGAFAASRIASSVTGNTLFLNGVDSLN